MICSKCVSRNLCINQKQRGCRYFDDDRYFKELLYTWAPNEDWHGILSMIQKAREERYGKK